MTEHYRLVKVPERPDGDFLVTQAFMDCNLCGQTIDSVDGPCNDTICVKCTSLIKNGMLKGLVRRVSLGTTELESKTEFDALDENQLRLEIAKIKKQLQDYHKKIETLHHTNDALKADNAEYKVRLKAALSVIDPEFRKQMGETYHSISDMLQLIRTRGLE